MQHLIDVRNQLDRYASPDKVDWHLACINNRWTKRALASAGFGYPTPPSDHNGPSYDRWKPIFSVAEIGGQDSAANAAEYRANEKELRRQRTKDLEQARVDKKDGIVPQNDAVSASSGSDLGKDLGGTKAYNPRVAVVHGLTKPLFHIDLTSALQSAIANVELRGEGGIAKGVGTKGI